MGPFVPDIITDQLNLIVALILGVGFGFVLEQAGFSSSQKLAGLFYGRDFTVLRVFFTAAVTAMSGIILLGYVGLLDTSAIYVNPTWMMPAIIGGVIMGVGFILGGYCPGTSICAAAIGKVDAMFFVGGGVLGVFLFGELFPLYSGFYESGALGPVKVFDSLGISQGLFAFLLIAGAVGAFAATSIIEKRVNKDAPSLAFPKRNHYIAALAVLALGVLFVFLPDRKVHLVGKVSEAGYIANHPITTMPIDELAFDIVDRQPKVKIIDVRPAVEFDQFALPGSSNIQTVDLFSKESKALLSQRHVKKVIVADDEAEARTAFLLIGELGFENVAILEGGIGQFRKTIFDAAPSTTPPSRWDADVVRFRAEASTEIQRLISEQKNSAVKVPKAVKQIKGGC